MSCYKTTEPIEMLFGVGGDPDPQKKRNGNLWGGGSFGPLQSIGSFRRGPKLFGRCHQRCGFSLSVLQQLVLLKTEKYVCGTCNNDVAGLRMACRNVLLETWTNCTSHIISTQFTYLQLYTLSLPLKTADHIPAPLNLQICLLLLLLLFFDPQ